MAPFAERRWVIAATAVVSALALVAAAVGLDAWRLSRRIEHLDASMSGSAPGGTTYLIVGDDSRGHVPDGSRDVFGQMPGDRADLLLVLRIPDNGARPTLLSIPRDLLVLDRNLSLQRVTLSWMGGPQETVDALCRSLGLGIDHLVRIRFDGFTELVDEVGGVDIQFGAPTRDRVLSFDVLAGVNHLDGAMALSYVRARHLEQFDGTNWVALPNERATQARAVLEQVLARLDLSALHPLRTQRRLEMLTSSVGVERGTSLADLPGRIRALRRVGTSADAELPLGSVSGDDDPIPFAELGAGAGGVLRRAGAGGAKCRTPALAEATW